VATTTQGQCPHRLGQLQVSATQQRVKAGGQAVVTVSDTYKIAGCPYQVPVGAGTKPQPCVTGTWLGPATKVKAGGQPVVLQTSGGVCQSADQIPAGPPKVTSTQQRVSAQ
jgi:hypothetical protein